MKKVICVALVLALCLSMTAFAAAPSRKTNLIYTIESSITDTAYSNIPPAGMEVVSAWLNAIINAEIANLFKSVQAAKTVDLKNRAITDFFGFNVAGMISGNGELSVTDFVPSYATNFPPAMADETVKLGLMFDTLFEAGEQVVLAIGMPGDNDNMEWNPFIGIGRADGGVDVTVPLKLMNDVMRKGSVCATITYNDNIRSVRR